MANAWSSARRPSAGRRNPTSRVRGEGRSPRGFEPGSKLGLRALIPRGELGADSNAVLPLGRSRAPVGGPAAPASEFRVMPGAAYSVQPPQLVLARGSVTSHGKLRVTLTLAEPPCDLACRRPISHSAIQVACPADDRGAARHLPATPLAKPRESSALGPNLAQRYWSIPQHRYGV